MSEILVQDDKTCAVRFFSSRTNTFFRVDGLTPEQAVDVKRLCLEVALDARRETIGDVRRTLDNAFSRVK